MTNYYIEKDNKIIFFDTDLQKLQNTIIGQDLTILETERPIVNFEFADTAEYIVKILSETKQNTYYNIVSKYDQAIKNGVFKIDSTYYGNMSWYDTWTKAVNSYESGLILADTFTVRLYKSPTSEDGVYYNYNTTQTLSSFKLMLQTLNSQQFLLYQPIRNNLVSQLKLATTVEQVNIIQNLIDTAFGNIIDEQTTIIQYGE